MFTDKQTCRADSGISLKQQSPTPYAKKKKKNLPTEDNRQAIILFYSQMFPFVLLKGDCATAVL